MALTRKNLFCFLFSFGLLNSVLSRPGHFVPKEEEEDENALKLEEALEEIPEDVLLAEKEELEVPDGDESENELKADGEKKDEEIDLISENAEAEENLEKELEEEIRILQEEIKKLKEELKEEEIAQKDLEEEIRNWKEKMKNLEEELKEDEIAEKDLDDENKEDEIDEKDLEEDNKEDEIDEKDLEGEHKEDEIEKDWEEENEEDELDEKGIESEEEEIPKNEGGIIFPDVEEEKGILDESFFNGDGGEVGGFDEEGTKKPGFIFRTHRKIKDFIKGLGK